MITIIVSTNRPSNLMKKYFLITCFLLNVSITLAQNEIDLFKLEYENSGVSNFSDSPYPAMDQIASANSIFRATLNYNHKIKPSWQAIHSISYSHVAQHLDLSAVIGETVLESIPDNYYAYPNFSQISLRSGVIYEPTDKWSATLLGSVNFTDDFSEDKLNPNLTWLTMAYLERRQSQNLSYGFGLSIIQLENKLYFLPSASFKVQNSKRGLELLFPEKIRVWQKINQKDYLEAAIKVQSLSVEYPIENEVKGLDIYTIKAGIEYNLIWEEFIKLNVGINLPIILNSVNSTTNNFEFFQQNSIGFNLGLSIILPYE